MAKAKVTTDDIIQALRDAGGGIDSNAIASSFLEAFGGPPGIAKKFAREYRRKGTSSIARVKILDAVMRMMIVAASKSPPLDLSKLNDEQLRGVVGQAIENAEAAAEDASDV